jgi:hypothetical protein
MFDNYVLTNYILTKAEKMSQSRVEAVNTAFIFYVIYLGLPFSGFGHYLAKRLDEQGFRVFAGCLEGNGGGAAELKKSCSDRLRVVQLDVTKDDQIKNARKCMEEVHRATGCGKKTKLV